MQVESDLSRIMEPYQLSKSQYISCLSIALVKVILQVENIFPKDKNRFEMAVQTVIVYAHLEYRL